MQYGQLLMFISNVIPFSKLQIHVEFMVTKIYIQNLANNVSTPCFELFTHETSIEEITKELFHKQTKSIFCS